METFCAASVIAFAMASASHISGSTAIIALTYLALLDGKLHGTDRDVSALLGGLADEAASRGAEFITVFYGEDVAEEDAHKARDIFTHKCPDAEINLICGGQPVYYYMISIE